MVAAWSFVLAASVGAPAEQLLPRADGTKAAAIAAASGVAAGVDAAHPSGVGNCISVSASVPDFWCGQQTSPPANLCKCGDDRLAGQAVQVSAISTRFVGDPRIFGLLPIAHYRS